MPLVAEYGDLSDDENYLQLIIDLVGLQNASVVRWGAKGIDPIAIFHSVKAYPQRSPFIIAWEMLFQTGEQHQAEVIMDKSLDNIHYASELMGAYDDLLFLNVVRDPRAQISSMNKAIIYDFDTLLNGLRWVEAYKAARELHEAYPGRVLTIRYEDFLLNQKEILQKICDFMSLGYSDAMLDIESSQEAQTLKVRSDLWRNNSSASIVKNIDKYKHTMSTEEIGLVESMASDLMAHYGYERITDGTVTVNDEMLQTARHNSEMNKHAAWERLKKSNPQDYMLREYRNEYIAMLRQRFKQRKNSLSEQRVMV